MCVGVLLRGGLFYCVVLMFKTFCQISVHKIVPPFFKQEEHHRVIITRKFSFKCQTIWPTQFYAVVNNNEFVRLGWPVRSLISQQASHNHNTSLIMYPPSSLHSLIH